jgi:hypothetical protein
MIYGDYINKIACFIMIIKVSAKVAQFPVSIFTKKSSSAWRISFLFGIQYRTKIQFVFKVTYWIPIVLRKARAMSLHCYRSFRVQRTGGAYRIVPKLCCEQKVHREKLTIRSLRGRVIGWSTMLQDGSSRLWFPIRSLNFSIGLILPATLWPWCHLSLWQKWVPGNEQSAGA